MATIEEKLCVLLEKLKETDHNLSTCIVLLQQYLRNEMLKDKIKNSRSIGIQVTADTKSAQTVTETGRELDRKEYQRNLSDICEKLKKELQNLHRHIEKQDIKL
ncbi:uncharacterized protein LOC135267179 [Tribolium castaneum]|uniref:uncharacterized protein LOC135267179 n=1 Tax=Tribolium castaneum TaxID=7070 RepID=UPI0030FEC732